MLTSSSSSTDIIGKNHQIASTEMNTRNAVGPARGVRDVVRAQGISAHSGRCRRPVRPRVPRTDDQTRPRRRAQGGRAEIYFADRGIDLQMILHRPGSEIVVDLHAGLTAAPDLAMLDGRRLTVDAEGFLDEWLALRDRLRRAFG